MNLDHDFACCDLEIFKDYSSCGVVILKEASINCHKKAIYMCDMILLCCEVEEDRNACKCNIWWKWSPNDEKLSHQNKGPRENGNGVVLPLYL